MHKIDLGFIGLTGPLFNRLLRLAYYNVVNIVWCRTGSSRDILPSTTNP